MNNAFLDAIRLWAMQRVGVEERSTAVRFTDARRAALTDVTERALAAELIAIVERAWAVLAQGEEGDVGASAEMWREWNRLHDENATLREALREISLHGTTAPLEMGDVSNDAAWWKRIAHDCISTAAWAVLAQGEEPK